MTLHQGFQPIPLEEREYEHILDKVTGSFYFLLSISALLKKKKTQDSFLWEMTRRSGPVGRNNAYAQLKTVTEDELLTLFFL